MKNLKNTLFFLFFGLLSQAQSFVFQGQLTDDGVPAKGNFDLNFSLFDSSVGGKQLGVSVQASDIQISGGVFSYPLNFPTTNIAAGGKFVQISVKPTGATIWTVLTPRQELAAVPIALYALSSPAGGQGLKGDTGAVGSVGPQGFKGDTGVAGLAGSQGLKGDTGAVGPAGSQGLKGDTGAVGPAGSQGLKGDTGAAGPVGPQGFKGDTGVAGLAGPQGEKGEIGPAGTVGADVLNNLVRLTLPDISRQATATASVTFGFITSVQITDGGSSYSGTTVVTVSDSSGSGAILEPVIVKSSIVAIIVKSPGFGYLNPKITIESPNTRPTQQVLANTVFTGDNSFSGKFIGDGSGLKNLPSLWRKIRITNSIEYVSYSLEDSITGIKNVEGVLISEHPTASASSLTTPDKRNWPSWKIVIDQMYWPGKVVGIVVKYRMGGTIRFDPRHSNDGMFSSATVEVLGSSFKTNHQYNLTDDSRGSVSPPGVDSQLASWPTKQYTLTVPLSLSSSDSLKPISISYYFACGNDLGKNSNSGGVLESVEIISEKIEYFGD